MSYTYWVHHESVSFAVMSYERWSKIFWAWLTFTMEINFLSRQWSLEFLDILLITKLKSVTFHWENFLNPPLEICFLIFNKKKKEYFYHLRYV